MGLNLNDLIKQQQSASGLDSIDSMTVIAVGAEPTAYKPYTGEVDANGKKIKSDKQTGWTLYFSELGSSRRVWYRHESMTGVPKIDNFGIYQVSGLGHNKKFASDVHIQEQCSIKKIAQLDVKSSAPSLSDRLSK